MRHIRSSLRFVVFASLPLMLCCILSAQNAENPNPGNPDVASELWQERYYVAVVVNEYSTPENNLGFLKADLVSTIFDSAHYQPLLSDKVLTGKNATRTNFITALKQIRRNTNETSSVVIFFSGHGIADAQDNDVWLQLYGQNELGDVEGISIDEILRAARESDEAAELLIIIDACHSGLAASSNSVTLKHLGRKAAIITSSSPDEESFGFKDATGEYSAFTYVLKSALGEDFKNANHHHDGLLTFEELKLYAQEKLEPRSMNPVLTGSPLAAIAYRPDLADPKEMKSSPYIRNLLKARGIQLMSVPIRSVVVTNDGKIALPHDRNEELLKIAQAIDNNDAVSAALAAYAVGDFEGAFRILEPEYNRAKGTIDAGRSALEKADLAQLQLAVARAAIASERPSTALAVLRESHWSDNPSPGLSNEIGVAYLQNNDSANARRHR